MWKALKYILIYFALQILSVFVVVLPGYILHADKGVMIVLAVTLSNLLFCWYISRKNRIGLGKESFMVQPWTILLLTVLAVLFFILPEIELIVRFDIPDNLGEELEGVIGTVLGLVSIGIIGPIAEELLFRGAVLGSLLAWKPIQSKPWIAVLLSAAIFSLIHLNPAQMPGAFAIGLLYGWLVYRTGSLLPGIVGHVFNNSLISILSMLPEDENDPETFSEMFSSPFLEFLAVAGSLIVCIAIVKTLVQMVNTHYPPRETVMEPEDAPGPEE